MESHNTGQEKLRLEKVYAAMVDDELLHVAEDMNELTDLAQAAIKAEIDHRGLELPEIAPSASAAPDPTMDVRLVTAASFRDVPEALLAKSRLEAAGMESFLLNEEVIRMDWFYSNAIGGIRLRVREEDLAAARQVLDEPIVEEFSWKEGEENYHLPLCPACQSPDIEYESINKTATYGLMMVVHLPIPIPRKTWKCHACGSRWEDTDKEKL